MRNKRITLNSQISADEIEAALAAAIAEKNDRAKKTKETNEPNARKGKKAFYNKWYLPVKFWNIQKKPHKHQFIEGISFCRNS